MTITKWDSAEEPTINIFFRILKCRSTEANRKWTEILLGDKCPRRLICSTSRDTCQVEKNLERDFKLVTI